MISKTFQKMEFYVKMVNRINEEWKGRGWDLGELLEHAKGKSWAVLGSIPDSSNTVENEESHKML